MPNMTAQAALEAGKNLDFTQVWTALMETRSNVDRMSAKIDELTETVKLDHQNIGGVGNSLGAIMEGMFAANICPKFDIFGHTFTRVSNDMHLYRDGKVYCEVDAFLENGDYVMAIEVKAQCEMRDINKHIERLEKLRIYANEHGDKRKILGGIACGQISDKLKETAESKGLYVMVQTGNAVEIAEKPGEFQEHVW
jgi:hypothetical protein